MTTLQRSLPLLAVVLAGALAAPACRSTTPPSPTSAAAAGPAAEAAAQKEVAAAMMRYGALLRSGPPEELAALYAEDGELLQPGMQPIHGRRAILDFLQPIFAGFTVERAEIFIQSTTVHGNTAILWGTYSQRAGEKGKPPGDYFGRYVAEWHKEADGIWRLARMLVQPAPVPSPK